MSFDETIAPTLAQAEAFLDDGHIDRALAVYHALIADGGEDKVSALFGVATCYARRKEWEEAEEVLNQVIQLLPTFAAAYAYRGAVLLELARVDESIANLDRAIEIDPTSAISYVKQAEVYLRLGLLPLAHIAVHTAAKQTAPDRATRDYIRKLAHAIDKEIQHSIPRDIPKLEWGWLRQLPWPWRAQPATTSSAKTGVVS